MYKYGKEGHFRRECPNWKKEEQVITLMSFDEDWGVRDAFILKDPTKSP
jgi:hypothetical protein